MISTRVNYDIAKEKGGKAETYLLSAAKKVVHGPGGESLMAFNTVRHYSHERLLKTSDNIVICAGTLRWITIGLENISISTDHEGQIGSVASVIVYNGILGNNKGSDTYVHQNCYRYRCSLNLEENRVEAAYIVDGPLLVTVSHNVIKVHSLQLRGDKSSTCPFFESKFPNSSSISVRRAYELGSIREVIITTLELEMREEVDENAEISNNKSIHFSALYLNYLFSLGFDKITHGDPTPSYLWGSFQLHGADGETYPCVPRHVPHIFSNHGKSKGVHDYFRILPGETKVAQELMAGTIRYAQCSPSGSLTVHEIDPRLQEKGSQNKTHLLAERQLPLNEDMRVQDLWCFGSMVCVCVRTGVHSAPLGGSEVSTSPFVLVFSAPSLHMLVELRGCYDMRLMQHPESNFIYHEHRGSGQDLEGVLACMVSKQTGEEIASTVIVPVSISLTRGTTVFRHNGSSRLCPPGTAANLLSIYEGSVSPTTRKGKTRKAISKKKRKLPDSVDPAPQMVLPPDEPEPPESVYIALKNRLNAVEEICRQMRDQERCWKTKLRGVRACLARAGTGNSNDLASHVGMNMILHDHQRIFSARNESSNSCDVPSDTSSTSVFANSQSSAAKPLRGLQVLSAICLPHASSMSVTILVRIRNNTDLPAFGLSLVASYLPAPKESVTMGNESPCSGSVASDSSFAPILTPGSEAWMTVRVQLTHNLFVSCASPGKLGANDGRTLLVVCVLWTGPPSEPPASCRNTATALMADQAIAVQSVLQGWVPGFTTRHSKTACVTSLSLEDMHWCSPPSASLFVNELASSVVSPNMYTRLAEKENETDENGPPLTRRVRERMIVSRNAALARFQAVGCVVARLPPVEMEKATYSLGNPQKPHDSSVDTAYQGRYTHCWLYWQLAAWSVDAANKTEKFKVCANNPVTGLAEREDATAGAAYYGYCTSVDVFIARESSKKETNENNSVLNFEYAAQTLSDSHMANLVIDVADRDERGSHEAISQRGVLQQLDRLLLAATELHPFLPSHLSSPSNIVRDIQPLSHTNRTPEDTFYSSYAHDLILEKVFPSDSFSSEIANGAATEEIATGRLVDCAHAPHLHSSSSSITAGLHGLQRTLRCSMSGDVSYRDTTQLTQLLQLKPVCDTDGALDAIRAAARLISLELKRLGTAMRDYRALRQRQYQQSQSVLNPLADNCDADAIGASSGLWNSLRVPIGAMNLLSAFEYLRSRSRTDLATAQALRGSLDE